MIDMEISFREALKVDLPRLVKMLAEDQLGSTREDISQPLSLVTPQFLIK